MFLPYMNKECFRLFSQQLAQELSDTTLLIVDRASTHQSNLLAGSSIVLHHLPAACPELNPVERVFKEIRRKLANPVFNSLQQAEHLLTKLVEELIHQPAAIISLTNYDYITSYL
jgi:transposase